MRWPVFHHGPLMIKVSALLVGLFLGITSSAQTPAGTLLVKDGQTVAFMGDSITGMGWGVPGGYVKLVVEGLAANGVTITPIPAGVGGNRSTEMLARVDADVIAKKPDWMLLSCGVNDVWSRSIDLDTFKKQMTAIVDKVQAAGIKIMILTPTPIYEASKNEFNDKLPDYAAFMAQLAKERNLPMADEHAAWLDYLNGHPDPGNANIVTIDGVHPNPDGHQVLAQTILAAFGATPGQVATAEKAWRAAPEDAAVLSDFGFGAPIPMPDAELDALQKMAAGQKVDVRRLVHTAGLQAALDLLQAEDLTKVYSWDLNKKYAAGVKAKLDALTNTASSLPAGNVPPQQAETGFRVSVAMPISGWDALKTKAAAQKIPLSRLLLTAYMQTIRDLLVAQGDLSKVWSDDISSKSTAAFKTKLEALTAGDAAGPANAPASTNSAAANP